MNFQLPDVSTEVLEQIPSPSVLVFLERVNENIDRMIRMAGSVDRLRPHCKTHKMSAVVELLLERGIRKHKAATIAEAEMLADVGVNDVMLAYNIVGPNIDRVVELARRHPDVQFSVTADHAVPIDALSVAAAAAGVQIGVFMDVNVGQNRTGIAPDSPHALSLYSLISSLPGLTAAGFHVYDGHQRHQSLDERRRAVQAEWVRVDALRQTCQQAGLQVPTLVCGGTPTFPVYAEMQDATIQLSPGTCIFHDTGYGSQFSDLPFSPAVAVLTRVISRPTENRATLDLGNKSIASDPPRGQRVYFPALPLAVQDIHNEEHLVLVDESAATLSPGDALLGIPTHICPTSALHERVYVIAGGTVSDEWLVTSRNRRLTV